MARNTKPKTDDKTPQTAPEAPQESQTDQDDQTVAVTPPVAQTAPEEPQVGQDAPEVDPEVTVTVNYEGGLNLRDGPHRSFNSLAVVPDGAVLTVLQLPEGAEVPGWALIRCVVDDEPLVGWVCTDFVRED